MSFSNAEAYDMLVVYFQCLENSCISEREYAIRYPNRRHYSRKAFTRLAIRLRQTGRVHHTPVPARLRPKRNEQNIINVLAYVEADPHVSIRQISRDLGISTPSVHRILKDQKYHPYHVVLHQALVESDFDRRLDYCYWLRDMCNEYPNFLSRILWTDEANFSSTGKVNLHNMHYWDASNPHWMREVDNQHRWSINVWCGILGNKIIGPFIFNGNLAGEIYLNFLTNDLPVLLEDVALETRLTMWYQQDGCPAHFSQTARNFLNLNFPNRWIGRGSLFPWPARSPDLTVLDFYLWGKIKDIVFQTRPTTPENMIQRIQDAISTISRVEIHAAVFSTNRRIEQCILSDGKQFEHL